MNRHLRFHAVKWTATAVNVILLILVFSTLAGLIMLFEPDAYPFTSGGPPPGHGIPCFSETLSFGFVTFTTPGYGDIVPDLPAAKSLALLTSIAGQLYMAVILALLVGKFVSANVRKV